MTRHVQPSTRARPLRVGGLAAAHTARSKASAGLLALCAIGPALLVAVSTGHVESEPGARAAIVGALAVIVLASTVATVMHVRRRPDTRSALMAVSFVGMSVVLVARVLAMVPGALYSPGSRGWRRWPRCRSVR